jgi:anti-anti-sigma factor
MATELTTQIENKTVGDTSYALVTLTGQIDESNLTDFGVQIDPLIGTGSQYLIFELAGLEFINSKVIGYLAAAHSKMDEFEQKMIFVNANQNIFDILELVGLTQLVPTLESEAKAVEAIQAGEI